MYLSTFIKSVLAFTITIFAFTGCGGSSKDSTAYLTGQFIDGPVAGLTYECSSDKTGKTNSNGEFTCKKNDTVTFKIGNVVLGSASMASVITPITLHPDNPEAATNVAQLLQTLAVDGDLSSFVIDETKAAELHVSLDVTSDTFEADVETMLGASLVDASSAATHLNESITLLPDVTLPTLTITSSGSMEFTSPAEESMPFIQPEETTPSESMPFIVTQCETGPATISGKVTDSNTGTSLANVEVSYGACTTSTNAEGYYTLSNVLTSERAVINFAHQGYYRNSKIIQIDQYSEGTTELSPNHLEVVLDKYSNSHTDDSRNEFWWSEEHGFGTKIPADIYIDTAGNVYNGKVTASRAYRASTQSSSGVVFPGAYKGIDSNNRIVPFISYGFVAIDLEDEDGTALGISDSITLTFPSTGATEVSIPLWYYDYAQGFWVEEGHALRQSDGTYQGEISHPGTWSLNKVIENDPGIYRGRIVHEDGTPAKDVRVHAIGDNWIASDLSTDADGKFEIKVIPDSSFTLKAYHYKDKYEAVYTGGSISGIASGDIVEF